MTDRPVYWGGMRRMINENLLALFCVTHTTDSDSAISSMIDTSAVPDFARSESEACGSGGFSILPTGLPSPTCTCGSPVVD